jgi:DNA-binding beta-propeller fold protein YncE
VPVDVTFAGDAVWASNDGRGTVTRIDAETGAKRLFHVGAQPLGIAAIAGGVWVVDSAGGTLSRIDVASLDVTSFHIGGAPESLSAYGDSLWALDRSSEQVIRVRAADGHVTARVDLRTTPNDSRAFADAVWVTDDAGGLSRIDPSTNTVAERLRLGVSGTYGPSYLGGRLWLGHFDGTDVVAVRTAELAQMR